MSRNRATDKEKVADRHSEILFQPQGRKKLWCQRKVDETGDDQTELIKTNTFFSLQFLNFIYGDITCVCTGHDHRSDNCVGEQRGLWRRGIRIVFT